LKDNSESYYSREEVADSYDEERFNTIGGRLFDSIEKKIVITNMPPDLQNGLFLDAGTGSGRFAIELSKFSSNVVALDYSIQMLRMMRKKLLILGKENHIQLIRQDITKLGLKSDQFQFICSIRVLINLDTEERVKKALNELCRISKPGGIIVVDIVNSNSIAGLGPRKESMISILRVRKMIDEIDTLKLLKIRGARILTQTLVEKVPPDLAKIINKIDNTLSRIFPFFCVRIYLILTKRNC
jgi:ubiquinone/menaquinone biosynthesis C-methylase UbiE